MYFEKSEWPNVGPTYVFYKSQGRYDLYTWSPVALGSGQEVTTRSLAVSEFAILRIDALPVVPPVEKSISQYRRAAGSAWSRKLNEISGLLVCTSAA